MDTYKKNIKPSKEFEATVSRLLKNHKIIKNAIFRKATPYEDGILKIDLFFDNDNVEVQHRTFHKEYITLLSKNCFPVRNYRLKNLNEKERIKQGLMDNVLFVFGEYVHWNNVNYDYYFPNIFYCTGKSLRKGSWKQAIRIFSDGNTMEFVKPLKLFVLRSK